MNKETHQLSLFMILLGSKAPARNIEQHDFYFGIGTDLKDLVADMKAFWPEAGNSIHIDGWRRISRVDRYSISVKERTDTDTPTPQNKLFFINLGGYQSGKLEEQHYTVLAVHSDRMEAIKHAKNTLFFKTNTLKGAANAHIDEKYGIDVDDVYRIEDVLSPELKSKYFIVIEQAVDNLKDEIHLGYLKLDKIK